MSYVLPKHYSKKYEKVRLISSGGYGQVFSAVRVSDGLEVAVKKIEYDRFFPHLTYVKRTLREFRIMRLLHHDNIVSLLDCFTAAEDRESLPNSNVFAVSELLETDLACILKSDQDLSDAHYKFFIYQVFRALKYVHSAGIVHRDLKPRNLLVFFSGV